MEFSIKRQTPPPLSGHNFHPFIYPTVFVLQLNLAYMKRTLHLVSVKNITVKSSYNWFKIDILRLVRPLTAIFSPVQGHLNYYIYLFIKLKLCAVRE